MINTYQTSLAPPPVPPRLNRAQPVLIPASLPSHGYTKVFIRFLVGVVVLHLFLSLAGFFYLNYKEEMRKHFQTEEQRKDLSPSSEKLLMEEQDTFNKVLARMVVTHSSEAKKTSGYLQWNMKYSVRRGINYYEKSWLTILQAGDYYVYSRVTFSKGSSLQPLTSMVKLRKNEPDKKETFVMKAYCYLNSNNISIPHMCTATQGDVIRLEKGDQLSVWVQDLSLVDYEKGATVFGIYKL